MNENKFRAELKNLLVEKDGFRVHLIENKIVPGMPDLLAITWQNQACWIETKTGTDLSKNQWMWIDRNPQEKIFVMRFFRGIFTATRMHSGMIPRGTVFHNDNWPMNHITDFLEKFNVQIKQ